ncbi:MAG: ABC-F family ATP-binding cassette domain-containing protein [Salibacteraceae bacterium]
MISVNNLGVSFGGIKLFDDVSFVVNERDRIGLVGKNGVGKSTLMKIIVGLQQPDSGEVVIPQARSVAYLPQEISIDQSQTVWSETIRAFEEVNHLKKREGEVQQLLQTRTDYESKFYQDLIVELGHIHGRLNILDDGKLDMRAERVLTGLGFKRDDFDRKLSEFSGGWQMRVELAKLILKQPDLLLLDEPTNHLDIESILWLESYFQDYPGAIMMISHDRMFLDNVTLRTIEIVNGKIYDYNAPYSKFTELRKERIEQQQAAFENQQKYIAQQERFIERFRAKNTKAKQVQSKIKQLEKLERVSIDDMDSSTIRFRFPPAPRSGDVVVKARSVSKKFGTHQVFSEVNFDLFRGERVAFVGQNGQGKTTLVRMIIGELEGEGELTIGHNVTIGYYAQIQEKSLDTELTVEQTIEREATGEMAKIHRIRGLLGAFLFGPDDFDKKVKVLSGGEKSRLAIARLLLKECNLLILDEPTNHLDMSAKEVLKNALLEYTGSLIVVSHDREFLQGLTNRTFEFGGGKLREHIGGIDEFLNRYKLANFREFEGGVSPNRNDSKPMDVKPEKRPGRTNEKELRKLRNQLQVIERKIEKQEEELKALELEIAKPHNASSVTNHDIFHQHAEAQRKLDEYLEQWETLGKKIEHAEWVKNVN